MNQEVGREGSSYLSQFLIDVTDYQKGLIFFLKGKAIWVMFLEVK